MNFVKPFIYSLIFICVLSCQKKNAFKFNDIVIFEYKTPPDYTEVPEHYFHGKGKRTIDSLTSINIVRRPTASSINLIIENRDVSENSYESGVIQKLEAFNDVEVYNSDLLNIDGTETHKFEFRIRTDTLLISCQQVHIPYDSLMLILTFVSPEKNYIQEVRQFDRFLKSVDLQNK